MKNKKKTTKVDSTHKAQPALWEKRRKQIEGTATFGLILVAVALAAPFTNLMDFEYVKIFKWIYAPGALIFTVSRIVGASDPTDSKRIKRLRRIECWAGIALCIAAFFWFYNESRFAHVLLLGNGIMACLRETIVFSLVGALIQVMASWMIYYRKNKEDKEAK